MDPAAACRGCQPWTRSRSKVEATRAAAGTRGEDPSRHASSTDPLALRRQEGREGGEACCAGVRGSACAQAAGEQRTRSHAAGPGAAGTSKAAAVARDPSGYERAAWMHRVLEGLALNLQAMQKCHADSKLEAKALGTHAELRHNGRRDERTEEKPRAAPGRADPRHDPRFLKLSNHMKALEDKLEEKNRRIRYLEEKMNCKASGRVACFPVELKASSVCCV